MSDQVVRLAAAGETVGAQSNPIEDLYQLDCVPVEIHYLVDFVRTQADLLNGVRDEFENTRRRLVKKWRGEAGDQFAVDSGRLLTTYIVRQINIREAAAAGRQIADGVDNVATTAAEFSLSTAVDVDPSSVLVLAHRDEAPEEAKQAVRQAIVAIHQMVEIKQQEITALGSALKGNGPVLEA
ncbi:hypothetical protein D5S18_18960 [Nocardia panacis]|uniref:Outer membrane channel protein CpnT-like N-terminal domain-containing protein n=1 Tax=Nocardia panacis TaxID=2340916 RepID=A0A3A4K4L3_9NOCA|nr:hypothetical protein [Nocardia panacis]RJO73331.1 hypothetical protein D5S18_18960 [Nocardia panacis]